MKLRLGLTLLAGVFSAFSAAPLPDASYLGLNKAISMNSYNGTGTAGGGGAFNGTLSGFATTMWCIDDQLYFAFGQSSVANVIGLNQITPNDTLVRYGDVHNASYDPNNGIKEWTNQTNLPDSAQDRYRMAAYLVSQYDSIGGNLQNGLTGNVENSKIQNTIWALTNNNSVTAQNAGVVTPDAGWLAQAKANYLNVDMTKWAVVSWTADRNGNLGNGGYGQSDGARQTFLVQVVPEPGFYGMLAVGFGGLYVALARRRKGELKGA